MIQTVNVNFLILKLETIHDRYYAIYIYIYSD